MKHLSLFVVLLSLLLVGCQPIRPQATQPAAPKLVSAADKIPNALSAGPPSITDKAAVMDWPAKAGGGLVELRAGTNGWTCLPDNSATPANDPRCFDKEWLEFQHAALEKRAPHYTGIGIAYMLQGDSVANNDDPAATQPPAGQEWISNGPHIMVVAPDPQSLASYTKDRQMGAPWIMFGATPREHLMVPVEIVASHPVTDKIANALSAGPAAITANAAAMDWPATMGGALVELRAGTNDWTCLPDDPTTPTNDPMCLDKTWMVWLKAYMSGTKPEITKVGIAYMLQGGSVADNNDPTITQPAAGKDWQIDPPHVMVVAPDPQYLAGFSKDAHSGGPWIMYGGTPYEHLMVPGEAPVKITSDTTLPAQQIPLTGTVAAMETYTITPPTMLVATTGSGESNELGHFTVTWKFTVNLDTGAGVGSAHFIAANGDSLDTTSLGQGDPTGKPDENRVVEKHTITGGTGRFAGATGTFTLDRLANKTGATAGSFDGNIVLQKAK